MRKTDPSQAHFICCLGAALLMLIVLLRCPIHAQGFQAARRLPWISSSHAEHAVLCLQASESGAGSSGMPAAFPLVEEMLADNFLHQAFQRFFEGLQDRTASAVPSELASASQQLQTCLQRCLGWDFAVQDVRQPDSDDEYAPVVVALNEATL